MNTMSDVEENLATASEATVGSLTEGDQEIIEEAHKVYDSLAPIPCTQCEYCLPCPSGVAIPRIFDFYNDAVAYDAWGHSRWAYGNLLTADERADNCVECGECEVVCPQNIKIIDWLATAHERLGEAVK